MNIIVIIKYQEVYKHKKREGKQMENNRNQTNPFSSINSLIDFLQNANTSDFPESEGEKTYFIKFTELNNRFIRLPVETGAMINAVNSWKSELFDQLKSIDSIPDETTKREALDKILSEDVIVYLTKHGPDHVRKVQEKALEILKCFNNSYPTCYEVFFLLCSISVHDVGNIFGRKDHEKKIAIMLEKECRTIIEDDVEIRHIARIAGVHSGTIDGSKDTLSKLQNNTIVNNFNIREQMIAAILRLADELADDKTRAIKPAMDNNLLGPASEIYHVYSSKLHTVKLELNPVTKVWEIHLGYEFDKQTAEKKYIKGKDEIYLLDEIYDRTLKMERERRYCMHFLQQFCLIESIKVCIKIVKSTFEEITIQYELTDKGYPDQPLPKSIKSIDANLMSGSEMVIELSK